ncbi:hypothetical protein BGZ74_011695, partial [Mortierella antarctica]
MKPSPLAAFLALSAIFLTTLTTLVEVGRPCRSITPRIRYPANLGGARCSVKVNWTVNSVYEGTMYLSSFPLTRRSRDMLFCIEGSLHYRYGFPYPQMTLTRKYSRHRYYPEVHVWNERDNDWAGVEYWDCVNV